MAKLKERFAGEIAIGAMAHSVILKGGQVAGGPVERHREPAGGIRVAKERLCHRLPALTSRIPGLQNGRQMLGGPNHSHGAAAATHEHHWLASGVKGFEQGLLHGGQRDIRAVAAAKTDVIDWHLLALELWVEAADVYDHICGGRSPHG